MGKTKNELSEINTMQKIGVIMGAFVISGIVGYIYETIFYYFNDGMIVRRGTSFGPWIQIYAFGAMLIFVLCYRLRKHPVAVFLIAGISSGVLEYIAGYCMYTFCNGLRSWDYNTEILNFGNIGGFVCLRSVLVFAIAGTALIYSVIPTLVKIAKKMKPKTFFVIMLVLACICLGDILYNDVLAGILHTTTARQFYESIGWVLN